MSRYTAELRTIIDNNFDIFDFTYNRLNESKAIISDSDLQKGFIDHYYFREVGFETLERFKHKLKAQWLESIEVFDKLLIAYNEKIDVLSNNGSSSTTTSSNTGSSTNKSIINDTPTSHLGTDDYATSITDNTGSTTDSGTITQTSSGKTMSDIELLEMYHNKIKDIITEFYNSFDNLFMQIF